MRILYITTVGSTMCFFMDLISDLIKSGDVVEIATNITYSDVPSCYREWGCKVYPLSCTRLPFDKGNLRAIREIRKIVAEGGYDLVHCHSPIAAMCTRVACRPLRKNGVKVLYTAHGFHFYKGAPLKNWLFYYPVEWLCAHWTDTLITINEEDYALAQKHMHTKRVEHVPGVGIDLEKFTPNNLSQEMRRQKRAGLGVAEGEKMLLSVGELIPRKNHKAVIRALAKINDPTLKYYICGQGAQEQELQDLIARLGVTGSVKLLGYRHDISELCECADLFIFPSLQEGLPVALMEAIACKTPVICSDIRGNRELAENGALFSPTDVSAIADKIREYLTEDKTAEAERSYAALKKFDIRQVMSSMHDIYGIPEKDSL